MARKKTFFTRNLNVPSSEATAIDVEAIERDRYAVTIDGVRTELDSIVLPHGAVSMIIDGVSYSVEFEEKGDEVDVLLRGQSMRFDVADERRLRMRAASTTFTVEGIQVILAPMPGKIVKTFVKPGDNVEEGQGLIVIEAMKMENELKSPKKGRINEIHTSEGATVENGAKLITIE